MPTDTDMRFARLVLKKGWVEKSLLLKALKLVDSLKRRTPDMTLSKYLGVKGLLTAQQIAEANAALRGGGRPTGAGPKHGAASKKPSRATPAPTEPAAAEGPEQPPRTKTPQKISPALIAGAAAGILVLIVAVYLVMSPKDGTARRSPVSTRSATRSQTQPQEELLNAIRAASDEPGKQLELVYEFLDRFPRGSTRTEVEKIQKKIESSAQLAWDGGAAQRAAFEKDRKYAELIAAMQAFEEEWRGTGAAAAVTSERNRVEQAWLDASDNAWEEIYRLEDEEKPELALAALRAFRTWCPEHERITVDQRIKELEGPAPGTTEEPEAVPPEDGGAQPGDEKLVLPDTDEEIEEDGTESDTEIR
jgi:hypothetical protein